MTRPAARTVAFALSGLALALALSGCAHADARLVPPLRSDAAAAPRAPSADAPFRVEPPTLPPVTVDDLPALPKAESFALDNGLRVVVVERRGFPVVAARLVVDMAGLEADDVGGRRASLLGRVYLSAPEGLEQTAGWCEPGACTVSSRAPSDRVGEMLDRIATLVTADRAPREARDRRLAEAVRGFDDSTPAILDRNAEALLFGSSHPYGGPPSSDPVTLAALSELRARAFVPSAATLVVAGDVPVDAVKREATQRFGAWTGAARPRVHELGAPPPAPEGPRIVHVWRSMAQVLGGVAARGPGRDSPDIAPFLLLVDLLGGSPASETFHHVREEQTAAYAVHGHLVLHPECSIAVFAASFQEDRAVDGMRALLASIHAATDGDFPPEAMERAKRTFLSRWRESLVTDEGVAREVATNVALGVPPDALSDLPARVVAVRPGDVRSVAQRYLATPALRVVLAGRRMSSRELAPLGFGEATPTDPFGRPGPAYRLP